MQAALFVTRNGELYEIDVETDTLTKLMDNVRSASAGYGFTIAVKWTEQNVVGKTRCGSLGDGTTEPRYTRKSLTMSNPFLVVRIYNSIKTMERYGLGER